MMPTWLVWFLVAGNVLNMAFDGTIIVSRFVKWVQRKRYEKRRGVRHYRYGDMP